MYNSMYPTYGQQQQVVKVNGANGARAYALMPNSTALLLDENEPLVWFVQSDGAGYKTVTPYKIEPYVEQPEPTMKEIMERLSRLEAKVNESNFTENEQQSKPIND